MAVALADDLTRVSVADIEKWEEDGDTLYVYGKCTTPDVDTDDQVVASEWSGPALKEYMAVAPTVRVQHNAQRDPAGSAVRVDVNRDGDGSHWLKAAVDEPVAQRLVKRGHLRAFSVGIARPVIERDVTGKARGGIIKGGKIVEVSLVDSPANRSCFLEIAKSAADGTPEFTGKVVGDEDVIQKALGDDLLTKDGSAAVEAGAQKQAFQADYFPAEDLSITFTPNDLARLVKSKFVQQHYDELAAQAVAEKRDFDPGVGGGVDRDKLPASSFAGPHRSFPVVNQSDVSDAMHLAGHADDPDQVRANVKRIANREGLSVPDDSDSSSKGAEEVTEQPVEKADAAPETPAEAVKEAEPDLTKDPEPEAKPKPVKKAKKAPKGKKKLPPWLNKPSDGDGDGDGDDPACKSVSDHVWTGVEGTSDIVCSKCHTNPAEAAGLAAAHPAMACAPVPDLKESDGPSSIKGATPASASGAVAASMDPVPAHREPDGATVEAFEDDADLPSDGEAANRLEAATGLKYAADLAPDPEVAALLRFKIAGADEDSGRLHDLTCPAYHPGTVAKYHPYADLGALIDSRAWQRKTLHAAAGPLEASVKAQETWQAALLLKTADPADVNQWRLEAYKAFRDANPGPGTFPTPGSVSPQAYHRPVLSDGRGANSVNYDAPNTSPQVATAAPNAQSFDRPPLAAAHQSPSPSHMKWDSGQYPSEQGQPTQLTYAQMQKEHQRIALVRMHDHLSRQFPEVCPLNTVNAMGLEDRPLRGQQPEGHPVPPIAGIGKVIDPEPAEAAPLAVVKAEPETGADMFADADVYKGFKKMRKKLGKKVLSGSMTVDEARAKLGRQFAQKGAEKPAEAVQKAAAMTVTATPITSTIPGAEVVYNVIGGFSADALKAAVREALRAESVPLEAATVESFDPSPAIEAAVTKAVTPLLEKIQAQDTQLAETRRVIDAIADQPDPSTAAFTGVAFKSVSPRRPAAVPDQAEYAARAQAMIRRNLQSTYETHSDPRIREAAGQSLASMGVEAAT